ncbi:MAG TPA: TIM barrel protein [Chitinophagaceae bacterium]|nr:TIM barrel protein [Chitinophagaceae bacterium]
MSTTRRRFLQQMGGMAAGAAILPLAGESLFSEAAKKPFFKISLAQWSLHKELFGKKLDNLDFPARAKNDFGISIVEYVNQFFKDKANDTAYLSQLLQRCRDNGVKNHLIMCDGEGNLGDTDDAKRTKAVENHYKWVDAAKYLGCATIRVNAGGNGTREQVAAAAVDGLSRLGEYGKKAGINVIVENHGSYSSDGKWLSSVMKQVNMKNVGTLPDLGNFCIRRGKDGCEESYDRYVGTAELMPFAKGVSAKTNDFDESGNCVETDYVKMMKIIKAAKFKGYIGIEYEGSKHSEEEGIRKTKALLEKVAGMVG